MISFEQFLDKINEATRSSSEFKLPYHIDNEYKTSIHPTQLKSFENHHNSLDTNHINHYKSFVFDSDKLNSNLRSGGNPKKYSKQIKSLDHITSKPTTHDIHAFKGFGNATHQLKNSKVGDTINDKGYTSTSTSPGFARGYGYNRGPLSNTPKGPIHIAHIHIPKGSNVHFGDKDNNQDEVTIHRNAKFKVMKPPTEHAVDDRVTMIHHLKLIGHEEK